jgi:hypothetical protein
MTRNNKLDPQMNLPLWQNSPIDLPEDKKRELSAALADLLWNAAVTTDPTDPPAVQPKGDEA